MHLIGVIVVCYLCFLAVRWLFFIVGEIVSEITDSNIAGILIGILVAGITGLFLLLMIFG